MASWGRGLRLKVSSGFNQRCFDLRLQLLSKLYRQFDVCSSPSSVCDGQHNCPVARGSGVNVAHYDTFSTIDHRVPILPVGAFAFTLRKLAAFTANVPLGVDRKSTRLNSSHLGISY